MANITSELQTIASGRYGKDVRAAIHDGIEKINNEATDYTSKIATVTSEIATHTSEITSLSTATSELSSEVTYIGSEVAVNTSDIADLKNKPSSALVLTSASPLATSSASNILGIECEGKSTQDTSIATVQGQVANTSGAINQDLTTNTTRCSSSVMQMVSGVTISVSSGYEIYLMYSASASGNITQKLSWASSQTTSADGYYRLMIRKSDNTTVAPTDFALSQTPTPTNPISIVDASGVVVAHNKYEYDGTLLQGYWDASSGQFVSNANNVCSADAIACEGKVVVEYPQIILRIAIAWYNGTTFIRRDNFDNVSKASADVPSNATHFKFNINTASAITPTSAQTIAIQSASNSINISTIATLRSIGTVADTLVVKEDGSGVLTQNIYKWETSVSTSGDTTVKLNLPKKASTIRGVGELMCNSMNVGSSADLPKVYFTSDRTQLVVRTGVATSVSDFVVQYILDEPIVTNLTSTQVASILALKTYNGTTIVDSEIVKDVTYSADVKTYVDDRCNYVSSTEMVVGEFDGKTLYRKVVEFESSYSAGLAVIITDETITIKRFDGCVKYKNRIYPIGCKSNKFDVYIDNNALHFDCDYMDEGYGTITAIVEYTKDDVNTLSEVSE